MSDVLEAALRHASRGRPVFPCCPRTKRPLTVHGFKDATTDPTVIRGWFERGDSMLGMPTGRVSRLVVIDTDGSVGHESLKDLERKHEPLPRTASVCTPSGGAHYYFKHPGVEVRCSASSIAPAVDVRGDGGYVVMPPSRTAEGRGYVVDEECAAAPMPVWLLESVAPTGPQRVAPATDWLTIVCDGVRGPDPVTGAPSEGRNAKLTRFVGHLLRRYVDAALVHSLAHLINEYRFYPPLPRGEVDKLVDSVAASELRRRRQADTGRAVAS